MRIWMVDIIDQWGDSVDLRVALTIDSAFSLGASVITELCAEGHNKDDFDFTVTESEAV